MIEAVVFDLDGVLIQTEEIWDEVRERLARERGGRYDAEAQRAMMGMSSPEWSRYMHEHVGLPESPDEIAAEVVERMAARYREHLPLIAGRGRGGRAARGAMAPRRRVVVEPAADRPRARAVRPRAGCSGRRSRRRRSPAASRRRTSTSRRAAGSVSSPTRGAAVEDSHAGIRSAKAAGMRVIAIPNPSFPPGDEALAQADAVLVSLSSLTVEAVQA